MAGCMGYAAATFSQARTRRATERIRTMAAPSFSTPQRANASRPVRRFTLEQANSALPLVKRIVADIVKTHGLASSYRQSLERPIGAKQPDITQQSLDGAIDRLEQLVDELS